MKVTTHMCHPNAGAEADVSLRLYSMELRQYPGRIWSQCGQHLTVAAQGVTLCYNTNIFLHASTPIQTQSLLLCHGDEAHVVFRVGTCFGVTNNINCVLLSLQPGGQKVSIAHVFTVVHTTKKETAVLTITSCAKSIASTNICCQH